MSRRGDAAKVVLVVGEREDVGLPDAALATLQRLGADTRVMGLWDEPPSDILSLEVAVRVVIVEGGARPDLARRALVAIRGHVALAVVPALLSVPERHVAGVEPGGGFEDFVVAPYFPAELYARIRALEWKASEFSNEERVKAGRVTIDRGAHEVTLDGRPVPMTVKELSLLSFLLQNRGRVHGRDALLARVWGPRYDGGPRTVDIHVRRLRAKLGDALPLETVRGAGYRLARPDRGGRS